MYASSSSWINLPAAALIIFHYGRVVFLNFWNLFHIRELEMGAIRVIFALLYTRRDIPCTFHRALSDIGTCLIHPRFTVSVYHWPFRNSRGEVLLAMLALHIHKGICKECRIFLHWTWYFGDRIWFRSTDFICSIHAPIFQHFCIASQMNCKCKKLVKSG